MPNLTTLDRPPEYYRDLANRHNPKHIIDCMCPQCSFTPVCCMVCKYEYRHVTGLLRHRTQVHELKKGSVHAKIRRRAARRELVPSGLGYLNKVFASPARTSIGTGELIKFTQHLQDLAHTKYKSKARKLYTKAKLQALKEEPTSHTFTQLSIPNQYLLPAYQIWEISGVQPSHILVALIAYGLEYLAKELRQYPVFPEVTEAPEKKLTTQNQEKKEQKEVKNDISQTKPTTRPRFL